MASDDADFTDEFCRFLQDAVPSVEAAELLLLLQRESARPWSAREAAAALAPSVALSEAEAGRHLEGFRARGLVVAEADARLRYQPTGEGLAQHAGTLDKVYRERPVTLIRVIYGLRDKKIRSFADAFKLRRK
jgi:hypothetical protein